MQEKNGIAILEHYFQLALRKRWFVIIPLCLAMSVGLILSIKTPKLYEAKTLILVEPQQVPGEVVKPIISQGGGSRISTASQQIMSRSNIEKIIQNFSLFPGTQDQIAFLEDKVEIVKKAITIQVTKTSSGGGEEVFTIAYKNNDPHKAMRVANSLASNFIEENLQSREEKAVGTTDFLEVELEGMRNRLEQLDSLLRDYRKRNMGELPEQLDANLRILESLGKQLDDRKERLRSERGRLIVFENEIDQLRRDLDKDRGKQAGGARVTDPQVDRATPSLPQLYDQLAGMRADYTEMHPDVIRLKKKIEDMEMELNRRSSVKPVEPEATLTQNGIESVASRQLADKNRQRMSIQTDISNLQQDVNKIEREIREYQQRIERTPKREEEFRALKRDYENLQGTYDSVLKRKLEADMSVNLEKKKKGEQFKVLDYARVPEKPVSPNLRNFFVISLAAGLGVGFGILFLFDMLNASVQSKDEMEMLGVPVLVTIPRIFNQREKRWSRVNNIASICAVLTAAIITVVFAFEVFISTGRTAV